MIDDNEDVIDIQEEAEKHRRVIEKKDLTEHEHYRSIERLAGYLFADEVLAHNPGVEEINGECPECGYEMNYYDVFYYAVRSGIHSREEAKEALTRKPTFLGDVEFDVQCVECGEGLTVEMAYICVWQKIGLDFEEMEFGEQLPPKTVRED